MRCILAHYDITQETHFQKKIFEGVYYQFNFCKQETNISNVTIHIFIKETNKKKSFMLLAIFSHFRVILNDVLMQEKETHISKT